MALINHEKLPFKKPNSFIKGKKKLKLLGNEALNFERLLRNLLNQPGSKIN